MHWGDTFSNRWIPAMDVSGNSLDANYPGGAARLRINVGIIYDQLKPRP